MIDTTRFPSASSDHEALADMFDTVSYAEPAVPFARDEYGLPILAPEPDDPDDE